MKITRKEVAIMAGVSLTTVSDALNQTSGARIKKETREKVLRTVKKLNYQPNSLARNLVLQKSFNIGIVICAGNYNPSLDKSPFTFGVLQGIQDTLSNFDYHMLFYSVTSLKEFDYQALFNRKRVDGLIVIQAISSDLKVLESNAKIEEYPVIVVNNRLPGTRLNYVDIDNERGILQAMAHLIDLGYREIGFAGGPSTCSNFVERFNAYKKGLKKYGLELDPEIVIETYPADYKKIIQQWILKRRCPQSIVTISDMLAIDMIQRLRRCGLSVPEDVGIVGFDDLDISAHFDPALTTIRQPMHEIGAVAAKELISFLKNKDGREQIKRIIQPELIVRESCGAKIRTALPE